MIAPGMVEEIKRLLADGKHSQRKVAKLTGISRATVGAIANGRRPDYPPRAPDEDYYRPTGPPQRCRGCGGNVYPPCQLCHVRAIKANEESRRRRLRQVLQGDY